MASRRKYDQLVCVYSLQVDHIFRFKYPSTLWDIIKSVPTLRDSGNKVYLQQINIYAHYKTVCRR